MAMFSINQVRQLYVAKKQVAANGDLATYGDIKFVAKPTSNPQYCYLQYASQGNSLLRSDLVKFDHIIKIKAVNAKTLNSPKYKTTVTVTQAVAGESYSIMLNFRNYIGIGDEDTTTREGVFTPTASTATAEEIAKGLSFSLNLNLGNSYKQMTGGKPADYTKEGVLVGQENLALAYADGATVVIEQVEQPWTRGKMPVAYMPIECHIGKIMVGGIPDDFGTVVTEQDGTFNDAGKKLADLEYFTLGARGDIYRGMGYPNNFDAEYLVNASEVGDGSNVSILEIHYCFTDSNESVQKSEKDIEVIFLDSADAAKTLAQNMAGVVKDGIVSSVDETGKETVLSASGTGD